MSSEVSEDSERIFLKIFGVFLDSTSSILAPS